MKHKALFIPILSIVFSFIFISYASADAIPKIKDNLTYGKKNSQVYLLQQELIKLGLMGGKATGVMYANTMSAVKDFQGKIGLNKTGAVGPETKAALNTMFAQEKDCLVVTTPQKEKAMKTPFTVSGFIKGGCAWSIQNGSAGSVQLINTEGTAISPQFPLVVRTVANQPKYPVFFTAQVANTFSVLRGAVYLRFVDQQSSGSSTANSKLYQIVVQ